MIGFPVTGTTALLIASAVAGAGAAGVKGLAGRNESIARANDLEVRAELEKTARRRDLRDEREATQRQLARTRAVLAARGAAPGVLAGALEERERESLIRRGRLTTDSRVRAGSSEAAAGAQRRAGGAALGQGVVGGAGSLLGGLGNVARR